MERDLTSGSVWKNIVYFSLPYLLSYFLQTLYGLADLFIVGQFDGVASTTAVSIGSQVMHMLTVMIVGLAMGTTVNIGRAVGARDSQKASKVVGNTTVLFVGVSVVLAVVLLVLVQPIVRVMSTPAEAVEGTVRYLTICFIGIPFITAYNVIASIFRGLGDSKSPMYFIAVACVANIALDYLFIGALHMGPAGAALGTTLSQTISVAVSLLVILKKKDGNLGKKSGFSTRTGNDGAGAQNRCSDRGTGWIYPGGIYHHHDHCQPQGTECSRCSRNRGKNHQFSVPGAIFNAFHGVCVGSTEHGSRQIRTCRSDSPICDGNRGWFRTHCVIADPDHRRTDGRIVYHGCDGHFAGGAVYPWIYLGLYFCRGTLQFQRLFLCLWKIRDFVCPQPDCDSLCPYSGRLPDFKDLPGYAVSDGTGYGDRFAAVGDHLYDCVRMAEKEGKTKKKKCLILFDIFTGWCYDN